MLDRVRIRQYPFPFHDETCARRRHLPFSLPRQRIVWLRVHRVDFHHRIERLVSRRVVLVVFQILSSFLVSVVHEHHHRLRGNRWFHIFHHRDGAVVSFVFLARTQRERVRGDERLRRPGARVVVLRASFRSVVFRWWCHIFVRARVCVLSSALPHTNEYLLRSSESVRENSWCGNKMIFSEKFIPPCPVNCKPSI